MRSFTYILIVLVESAAFAQRTLPGNIGQYSDVLMWLEPDTNVYRNSNQTAAIGNKVSEWRDISANGNIFSQSSPSLRPTLVTDNNYTYLNFEAGSFLSNNSIKNALNGLTEFSAFVVIKSDETNTDKGFLYYKKPPAGVDDGFYIRYNTSGNSNSIKTGIIGNAANQQVSSTANTQSTNRQILIVTWKTGEKLKLYINGILDQTSGVSLPGPLSGISEMVLGKGPKDTGASDGWNGKIGTVIFYKKQYSTAQITAIADALTGVSSRATGNWNSITTWSCNCIPKTTDAVRIKSTHTVTLTGNVTAGSIKIDTGGVLNFNSNTLSISGNFENSGKISGVSNLTVTGTGAYTLSSDSAWSLNTLTVSNTGGTVISGAKLGITERVNITAGALNTGDLLVLETTTAKAGAIGPLPSVNSLTGKVEQKIIIPAGTVSYHYMGAPAPGLTLADFKAAFPITGNISDPTNIANKTWPSIYSYNESANVPTTADYYADISTAWLGFPAVKTTTLLTPVPSGRGYAFWVRNPVSPGTKTHGNITMSVLAAPHKGKFDFTVTYTANDDANRDGWNLISNPYPSPIKGDMTAANGWTVKKVNRAIYVYNPAAGTYVSYINGNSNSGSFDGIIRQGQAFFVKANQNNPDISVTESVKTTGTGSGKFYRTASTEPNYLRITISDSLSTDYFVTTENDSATVMFDGDYDAEKLINPGINISTFTADSVFLSIAAAAPGTVTELPLTITGVKKSKIKFSFEQVNPSSDTEIKLLDKYYGTEYDLDASITFDTTEGYKHRYALVMRTGTVTGNRPVTGMEWKAKVGPMPCSTHLNVYLNTDDNCRTEWFDPAGNAVPALNESFTGEYMKLRVPEKNGIYFMKLQCTSGSQTFKVPVMR